MTKNHYAIPITIISFIINVSILFDVVELNEDYAITFFFPIFMAIGISVLTCRFFHIVSSFCWLFSLGLVIGTGMFLYTGSFMLAKKIFLGVEFAFLIAVQSQPEISAKKDIAKSARQLQIPAKSNISELHELVRTDLEKGLSNKEICSIHNLQPYQVTRIKKRIENESKREVN